MGGAVGADQPRAVHGEAHRKGLDRHIVHHLIVGPLQEGRIDRAEGLEAFAGKPGRKGHGVLLGDADIEAAIRKALRRKDRAPCPTASLP